MSQLEQLRMILEGLKAGTKVRRPTDPYEQAELHTIYRTLNVVLAEIDTLQKKSDV